jgi:hypothetical protein
MTSIKKKYGRGAIGGEVPSAFATMAKADKIGTEKFTAKKTYGGDVGLGLNSDALEIHRQKLAEKKNMGGALVSNKSSLHSRGSTLNKQRGGGGRPKVDILSLVDGAIEDGATSEAKEKVAAERAAADAPILPKKKVKVKKTKQPEESKPPLLPQQNKKEPEEVVEVVETKESEKSEEVVEAVETKESEKIATEPPKPRSAKFLSNNDKAIEPDGPSPGIPSLFGSSISKSSVSNGGVPAWKAKLKTQKANGEILLSPTPKKQVSAKSPITVAKKVETIPKKSKSSPLVAASQPKSPVEQPSPIKLVTPVKATSPKLSAAATESSVITKASSPKLLPAATKSPVVKKSPLRSPKAKVSPAVIKSPFPSRHIEEPKESSVTTKSLSPKQLPAATKSPMKKKKIPLPSSQTKVSPAVVKPSLPSPRDEKITANKPNTDPSIEMSKGIPAVPALDTFKPSVYDCDIDDDSSVSSDDSTPKREKSPFKVTQAATVVPFDKPEDSDNYDDNELAEPTLATIAAPTLDPSLLVPSGDARLDRLRKELDDSKKKLESVTVNAKLELADMKKEYTLEKETLRIKFMKDIQTHKKANEKADKEHQKIMEQEQAQVEELKAANARLRATLKKLPMQMAEVTLSSESLSKANEDIAGHFEELNKFAKKLQADQNKLQESSRKCKDEYLPRYRQELWERQQHLNAETKVKNLYRDCMIKIHHRIDETNQVDLIEDVATMVLETEGEVNPKFDPKFLSQKTKKNSTHDVDSESDSDSDSDSSDSDSDSDSD